MHPFPKDKKKKTVNSVQAMKSVRVMNENKFLARIEKNDDNYFCFRYNI